MTLTDLYKIIDDYDDDAFIACREALYNYLDFHVIQPEEIRRIDLKEKLAEFFIKNKIEENIEKKFITSSERISDYYIIIESGSDRICRYDELRKKYAEKLLQEKSSLATLENYILVYLSHFRGQMEAYNKYIIRNLISSKQPKITHVKAKIKQAEYYLYTTDIEVLKYICSKAYKYYADNNGIVDQAIRLLKRPANQKTKNLTDTERLSLYILGVLFFYRILQIEGEI